MRVSGAQGPKTGRPPETRGDDVSVFRIVAGDVTEEQPRFARSLTGPQALPVAPDPIVAERCRTKSGGPSMTSRSPISHALHDAFARHVLSILEPLGFEHSKPAHTRPGLVAVGAIRVLAPERRAEATLWCDGGTGANLRVRIDRVEPIRDNVTWGEVELGLPWDDGASPNQRSIGSACAEFLPHESEARLRLAVEFIAGGIAANNTSLAAAFPELAEELEAARSTSRWQGALDRGRQLWEERHVRGDVETRTEPARVVFVGKGLVTVESVGTRFTFRFDTQGFDRKEPTWVGAWYKTPAGSYRAYTLVNGSRTWRFDVRGAWRRPET